MANFPRVVVVTGSNRGIGLEFVRQLAKAQNAPKHIFATCRQPAKAEELQGLAKSHGQLHILPLDIGDDQSIESCVKSVASVLEPEKCGVNLLINNAGIMEMEGSKLPGITRKSVGKHLDVHATAALLVSQAFLPLLKTGASQQAEDAPMSFHRAGIVNISSGLGSISGNTSGAGMGGYGYRMGKAALNMATQCLSIDVKGDKIMCVAICPGWVQTDMGGKSAALTTEASVSTLLNTVMKLGADQSGTFLQRNGEAYTY